MCRLLAIKAEKAVELKPLLEQFARIAKNSREYQGHGWGLSRWSPNGWQHYHNISPIWEDSLSHFGQSSFVIAHARSAFRDEGIQVENNMPFFDQRFIFAFNGELRGVRIKEQGRIGAEKIFNYIKRFDKGDSLQALQKGVEVITKRSSYVRAMNILMADQKRLLYASRFNQEPEYFQMSYRHKPFFVICSDPFPDENHWKPIPNNTQGDVTCLL